MVERLRASQPKAGAPSLAYIARAKVPGVPNYAKAGNLNHALDLTTGRFIVVFGGSSVCVHLPVCVCVRADVCLT
jgi:hypothetical protein